jgi:cation diffusion facilitator family transporter
MNDLGRVAALKRGIRLELFTVGWNVLEGVIGVCAAVAAGSVALLGFGIDSFIETASGLVLLWRLLAERRNPEAKAVERIERLARKLVAVSLFGLAGWIAFDATTTLARGHRPSPTSVGVALTAISIAVMLGLARAKRQVARSLGSAAMEADAFQTTACWWLSCVTLLGLGLNSLVSWWWADPVAGLGVSVLIVREGWLTLRGKGCCE